MSDHLVSYVRAAAATATRCGLPIIRPLCLRDPSDARGFTVADAYGYGPSLWVAPVVEDGVDEREVPLPRGRWVDFWTGERAEGGTVAAAAALDRIPVFVRDGALVPTYPAVHVAAGLGDTQSASGRSRSRSSASRARGRGSTSRAGRG